MQSVREMLDRDDFEFRFDVGICDASFKVNLSDRDRIVESLATYYTVVCGIHRSNRGWIEDTRCIRVGPKQSTSYAEALFITTSPTDLRLHFRSI